MKAITIRIIFGLALKISKVLKKDHPNSENYFLNTVRELFMIKHAYSS